MLNKRPKNKYFTCNIGELNKMLWYLSYYIRGKDWNQPMSGSTYIFGRCTCFINCWWHN